ncbi:MAG TPA: PilZ domain-containing protein [Sphingomonadaceae bacterium]|nr:PilZ domain-containing protein [Sphingomonadaceae bacterium]
MRLAAELAIGSPDGMAGTDGRRTPRYSARFDASLRRREGKPATVTILDLSTHGFRAETAAMLQPGAQVWLRLPGLEASLATIAWTDDIQIGAEFVRPLHPAVADRIVAQAVR